MDLLADINISKEENASIFSFVLHLNLSGVPGEKQKILQDSQSGIQDFNSENPEQ